MSTCPCGIARVDCEYHRPEPEPVHDDEWVTCSDIPQTPWLKVSLSGGGTASVKGTLRLTTSDGYVRTYQDGKLVDEEPAEAYQDHTVDALAYAMSGVSPMHTLEDWLPRTFSNGTCFGCFCSPCVGGNCQEKSRSDRRLTGFGLRVKR